jgi:hypothetical protein
MNCASPRMLSNGAILTPPPGLVTLRERPRPGTEDLLNLATVHALRCRGRVHVFDGEAFPGRLPSRRSSDTDRRAGRPSAPARIARNRTRLGACALYAPGWPQRSAARAGRARGRGASSQPAGTGWCRGSGGYAVRTDMVAGAGVVGTLALLVRSLAELDLHGARDAVTLAPRAAPRTSGSAPPMPLMSGDRSGLRAGISPDPTACRRRKYLRWLSGHRRDIP